jgi:hypothetical protein
MQQAPKMCIVAMYQSAYDNCNKCNGQTAVVGLLYYVNLIACVMLVIMTKVTFLNVHATCVRATMHYNYVALSFRWTYTMKPQEA